MASGAVGPPYLTLNRREGPWLSTSNRKLRHLRGIALRNLTFASPWNRPRGKTIDDEALPNSFKTPAKLLAQHESKKLEHSRSASDLRASATSRPPIPRPTSQPKATGGPGPVRPSVGRLRRRSTLEWANATPVQRQKKLEEIIEARMADVFFSLHVEAVEEPLYVSEIAEQTMNPTFRSFDLTIFEPAITRIDNLTIKFWAKAETMDDYQFLAELSLNLRSLQFIGKSLDGFHQPLPANCIILSLVDGLYTSFNDLPTGDQGYQTLAEAPRSAAQMQSTSSYDALMRLSNLEACIQDAILTRQKLTAEIEAIIQHNKYSAAVISEVDVAQDRLVMVKQAGASVQKQVEFTKKKRDTKNSSLEARKDFMRQGRDVEARARNYLSSNADKLQICTQALQQTRDEISGQRRRICEDLQQIYPIEAIPGRSLAFTIRGLPLPNSDFSDVKEDVVSAALGHVAHLVYLLAFYLSVPLLYPVQPCSSTSVIQDPISIMAGMRTFPLYMKASIMYRFEYGVFLLNKNIELLCSRQGLKILDIRQTLPNLKYLLYVVTAGKGDLPARQAGGVRGLLRGVASPAASRNGSCDSTTDSPSHSKRDLSSKNVGSLNGNSLSALQRKNTRTSFGTDTFQSPAMRKLTSNV